MIRLNSDYLERVLRGDTTLNRLDLHPCGLVLGSFDGLHRGHQELVAALRAARERHGLKAAVLFTFRRHPRMLLGGIDGPFLLTTWREKLSILARLGVDVVVALDFIPELSRLDYRSFVQQFLVDWLGMTHLVVGHDVHLGEDRRGTADTLAALGEELGYRLEVLSAAAWQGRVISSSGIRHALAAGDCAAAAAMLGRPYAVWGEVCPGEGRGREIGYPTANVRALNPRKLLPSPGVYACLVQVPGDVISKGGNGLLGHVEESLPEVDRHGDMVALNPGRWRIYGGMLNFGRVPTFHEGGLDLPRIEVHLLDFVGDLRGRTIKVEWLQRLRDEKRHDGVEDLLLQLSRDERRARQVIAAAGLPAG
jgi:riboflavin kinase / FMN adenylyltransferase